MIRIFKHVCIESLISSYLITEENSQTTITDAKLIEFKGARTRASYDVR